MRWLVTGGAGFIGTNLIARLMAEGHQVRVYDNLSVGTRDALAAIAPLSDAHWQEVAIHLVEGELLDAERLAAAAAGAEVIVHLAANTGVPNSVAAPRADCESNVLGTLNALEAARAAGVTRFVFASSGAPAGAVEPPIHEEIVPKPVSPYGASKLAGEAYCSAYCRTFGIGTVALRFGNVYGPGSSHKGSVVAKFLRQALNGEPLEIFGDGRQTRDFIHVSDIVEAIMCAAVCPAAAGEVFQIATARETTVAEVTDILCEALAVMGRPRPLVIHGDVRAGDVQRNFSDTSKARRVLGWQAKVELTVGVTDLVRRTLA